MYFLRRLFTENSLRKKCFISFKQYISGASQRARPPCLNDYILGVSENETFIRTLPVSANSMYNPSLIQGRKLG